MVRFRGKDVNYLQTNLQLYCNSYQNSSQIVCRQIDSKIHVEKQENETAKTVLKKE